MMRKLVIFFTIVLTGAVASAQEAPAPAPPATPVLTLREALRTAAAYQPSLRQAHATSEVAGARSDEAMSPFLPSVTGNASYKRSTANFAPSPGSSPTVAANVQTSTRTFNYFSFGVSASQLVWDFGRTLGQYDAAKATAQSQREAERTTAAQVVLAVEAAFFAARAQKALLAVATEALANQDRHLRQTQGFVTAGTHPEIDLAQARTNRANAVVQVVNSENAFESAKAQLNQAMGVEGPTSYDVADEALPAVAGEDEATEAMLPEALQARPEFAVMASQIRAQEAVVKAVFGNWFPTIGVSTGLTDAGTEINHMAWNWNGLVSLSWPIVQGGLQVFQTREARATLEVLKAQADTIRQQVRLDVEQARLGVRAAKAAIVAIKEAVTNAREQLRLAEARYATGVGNSIELSDAQYALTNAQGQQVQADFNLSSARAQLVKALGRR